MNADGSQDKNLLNFGPQHNGTTQDFRDVTLKAPGPGYTGIIKATSGVQGMTVLADEVVCAKETGCDVHNGASGNTFIARVWDMAHCLYGFSNKAGSVANTFRGLIRG